MKTEPLTGDIFHWLNTESECAIDSCTFNENFISNSVNKIGHAIYVNESTKAYITNISFSNYGTEGEGSVNLHKKQWFMWYRN